MKKNFMGFSLLELLIVITIITILSTISFSFYFRPLIVARRMEAETILLKLSAAMEQFYIENNTYENASLAELGFNEEIVNHYYRLNIIAATLHGFVISALPSASQAELDHDCGTLSLDEKGTKMMTGQAAIQYCW